jgi:hypothetical protein
MMRLVDTLSVAYQLTVVTARARVAPKTERLQQASNRGFATGTARRAASA